MTPEVVERVTRLALQATEAGCQGCALSRVAQTLKSGNNLEVVGKSVGLSFAETRGVMRGWDLAARMPWADYLFLSSRRAPGFDEGQELGRVLHQVLVEER